VLQVKAEAMTKSSDHDPPVTGQLVDDLASEPAINALYALAEKYLQMPGSGVGLFYIVENLKEILPLVQDFDEGLRSDAARLLKKVNHVAGLDQSHPLRCDEKFTAKRKISGDGEMEYVQPPLHGHIESHPVWCALWFKSGTRNDAERHATYRRLQAWYLGAWMNVAKGKVELDKPERVGEAGRLLRKIHHTDYAAVLDRLSGPSADKRRLHAVLAKLHENGKRDLRHYSGAFADLLDAAFDMGKGTVFREKQGKGRGRGGRKADRFRKDHAIFWDFEPKGEKDAVEDWPVIGGVSPKIHPDDRKWLEAEGIDEDEYRDADLALIDMACLVDRDIPLTELPPLGTLYAAAAAAARQTTMSAQRFTTRWPRVRLKELVDTVTALDEAYKGAQEKVAQAVRPVDIEQAQQRLETVILAATSFVTGEAQEILRQMSLVNSKADLPDDYSLCYAGKYGVWIRSDTKLERKRLDAAATNSLRETTNEIVLTDVWGVGQALIGWLEDNDKGVEAGTKPFGRKTATYRKWFKEAIAPKMQANGVRPKWCRLEGLAEMLPSWFVGRNEGDGLPSAMIFGRNDRSVSTQRYYTAIERRHLWSAHQSDMRALWKRITEAGFTGQSGLFSLKEQDKRSLEAYVGDERVVRLGAVESLIQRLQDMLQADCLGPLTDEDMVACHNHRTSHLGLALAIVTGFRAVRTPIVDLGLIDEATGFMPLQEKDRADGAHARIVWIPPLLRKLIEDYLKHLESFFEHFKGRIDTVLAVKATKHRDRNRFGEKKFDLNLTRTLFYVQGTDEGAIAPVEFTGLSMKKALDRIQKGAWPVANAGRHFLRSYLFEEGCPDIVIDAHFGHWRHGESVWDRWSAFNPHIYRQTMAPYLEALMTAIGLKRVERGNDERG